MTFDPSEFNKERQLTTGIARANKPVETPQADSSTEQNRMVYLRNGSEYFKIHKTASNEWSVWRYSDDGQAELVSLKRLGKDLNGQEAKRLATRRAAIRSQD